MNTAPWQNLLDTLGWTLLHSLWQLSLIAAVAATARLSLRKSSSQARYALAYISLLAMIAAPIATYAYLWSHRPPSIAIAPLTQISSITNAPHVFIVDSTPHLFKTVPPPADLWKKIVEQLHALAPLAAAAYLLGALALMLRLLLGYRVLRQVCAGAVPASEHDSLLTALRHRLRIAQPVLLKLSPRVEVPTVIGAFRPMILLPLTALTGLSTEQLTHLLLHEFAHIRRHDYLANLLQSIIETLLFYHPAVIWISAQVRQEREHCCDDLAIAAAGNPARYAESLATMESLRASPTFAISARGGSLLSRIRRILQVPIPRSPAQRIINTTSLLLLSSIIALALTWYLAACSRNETPPPTAAPATTTQSANFIPPLPNRPAKIGDVLHVAIYGLLGDHKDYDDVLPIDENGNLPLLFVGNISAVGKTPRQVEQSIAHALVAKELMHDPDVRVDHTFEVIAPDHTPLQENQRVLIKVFGLDVPGEWLVDDVYVDENGDIPVRHMGRIHVAGMTSAQAAAFIGKTANYKGILKDPACVRVGRLN